MIRRALRAAMLAIVAIAALVVVPSASAGQATLISLTPTSTGFQATWTLPDASTSSLFFEISDNPTFSGFTQKLPLAPTATTISQAVPPGTYYARVITTIEYDACGPDPNVPGCSTEVSTNYLSVVVQRAGNPANLTSLTQSGGVLTAKWELPALVESWDLEVATSPSTDPFTGYFDDLFTFVGVDRNQTEASTEQLPPGTYYVHIISTPSFDDCLIDVNDPLCFLDFSNILSVTVPAPAAPPSPPPPPPVAAVDKVLALGAVTAASSQDVDKLSITLNPGESVKVKLSGSVNVPGASKVFRFTTLNKSLGAGKTKLRLKLPKKAKKAVKKALKRKKKLKAKLTLIVTDGAGNSQTKKYSVRLKP